MLSTMPDALMRLPPNRRAILSSSSRSLAQKKTAATDGLEEIIMWRNKGREPRPKMSALGSRCLIKTSLVKALHP